MFVCMCVCIYVLVQFPLLATRLLIQHFNIRNVVELNVYIQTVYMFWCCHIIYIGGQLNAFARDPGNTFLVLSEDRNFLLTVFSPLSLLDSSLVSTSTCMICFINNRISTDVCVFNSTSL